MGGEVLEFTEVDTVINFKMVVSLKRGLNGQWKREFSCCDSTILRLSLFQI